MLSWCCGSMSCVVCELYAVQNEPGYGCASCAVQRGSHAVQRGSHAVRHTTHIHSQAHSEHDRCSE